MGVLDPTSGDTRAGLTEAILVTSYYSDCYVRACGESSSRNVEAGERVVESTRPDLSVDHGVEITQSRTMSTFPRGVSRMGRALAELGALPPEQRPLDLYAALVERLA
jgi:hypothetical protein